MTTVNTHIRTALETALSGMTNTLVHNGRLRAFAPDDFHAANGKIRHIVINTVESDYDDAYKTLTGPLRRPVAVGEGLVMNAPIANAGGCCELEQSTNVEVSIWQSIDTCTELELDAVESIVLQRIARAHMPEGVDLRPSRRSIQRPQVSDSTQVAVLSLTYVTLFGVNLDAPEVAIEPTRV